MSNARQHNTHNPVSGVRRRTLLRGLGTVGVLTALGGGRVAAQVPSVESLGQSATDSFDRHRLIDAYEIREAAARLHTRHTLATHTANGDETLDGYVASFTKGLPHDDVGEVDPVAYEALLAAIRGVGSFDDVPLGGDRKLVNPQAALSFAITGPDPHDVTMPPAPAFSSAEAAAEMVELYWQALLRDVPFDQYATNELARAAAANLTALEGYAGPRDEAGHRDEVGVVTPDLLFRGSSPGDRQGPMLSQFFYLPVPRGDGYRQDQQYRVYEAGADYMTTYDEWLARVNGVAPEHSDRYERRPRYLSTGRDLATYVHRDYAIQSYLDAALVLLGLGAARDSGMPDSSSQAMLVDFGAHDVLDAVPGVLKAVQQANWAQKWLVHRRLRPEQFGGRVHTHLTGAKAYPLHEHLLTTPALAETADRYGSYLLPQAYPEGSPLHPSYPAGHAGIAGACTTVLKAYFDESWVLPDPVAPSRNGTTLSSLSDSLTVGGELGKLASNMCIGRNWAGIHYRSDAADGLRLGEQVAVGFLADRARVYDEAYGFEGFTFTSFDGERLRVTPDGAAPA